MTAIVERVGRAGTLQAIGCSSLRGIFLKATSASVVRGRGFVVSRYLSLVTTNIRSILRLILSMLALFFGLI